MTNAQLVLDKIQETICTEDTTYEGSSGIFKFITGKTTAEGTVNIGIVGKYTSMVDAYKSLIESIFHGGLSNKVNVSCCKNGSPPLKWIWFAFKELTLHLK